MGCLRLHHNYFRASNVSSYVVLETFFEFLLVGLPRHPVHEFVDLQDSCQNIASSDWRVLPATMHARANLSSVGVIIATRWTLWSVIAPEIPTQMLWIRSWNMEAGDAVVVCNEDRATFMHF
jgi:hypothetical protein